MSANPPAMVLAVTPEAAHRLGVRVYYEDTDAGGVVYHARYLHFAERARTEALRDLQVAHADLVAEHGLMFVVRRVMIEYAAPARLDDSLVVATWPARLGSASIDLRQTILRGPDTLATAEIVLVCVRRVGEGPKGGGLAAAKIPQRWRTALASLGALGES